MAAARGSPTSSSASAEPHLAELHALRSLRAAEPIDTPAALLTEDAALHVEARLRVLELAEHDVPDIVTATATASQTARSRRAS